MCCVAQSENTRTPANLALAAELRAEAAAIGLSHKALAEKAGIPYGNVVKTMSAVRHTTVTDLVKLAVALGLTPSDIATRTVTRMGGMEVVIASARAEASGAPANVTPLRPRTAEEVDAYAGDKAAYRDPEAETDED